MQTGEIKKRKFHLKCMRINRDGKKVKRPVHKFDSTEETRRFVSADGSSFIKGGAWDNKLTRVDAEGSTLPSAATDATSVDKDGYCLSFNKHGLCKMGDRYDIYLFIKYLLLLCICS